MCTLLKKENLYKQLLTSYQVYFQNIAEKKE